jgi:SsrA-binding protein
VSGPKKPDAIKPIARNRKAFHDFEVIEKIEAGISLKGTEVKSLRAGQVAFNDAHARIKGGEVWLVELHIAPYAHGTYQNHEPKRPRKLLLHRRQIRDIVVQIERLGLTLVPIDLYFKNAKVKVELAVCRGKKKHDKREALKKQQDKRSMDRESKRPSR